MVLQGLNMNLFDAAYLNLIDQEIDKAQKNISIEWPNSGEDEILNAIEKAKALIDYAEHCAEMTRKGKLEKIEAVKEIRRAHPGFSEETYGFAFNNGLFLTR